MTITAADLKFRAQLVVPAQREMFEYWLSRRGDRPVPLRRDIHPRGFVRHLSTVRLIEVEREPELRFKIRLAGSYFRDIYGKEITRRFVDTLDTADEVGLLRLLKRGYPTQGVTPVTTYSGDEFIRFWLNMPLSRNGRAIDQILSYDAYLRAAKALALTSDFMSGRKQERMLTRVAS